MTKQRTHEKMKTQIYQKLGRKLFEELGAFAENDTMMWKKFGKE